MSEYHDNDQDIEAKHYAHAYAEGLKRGAELARPEPVPADIVRAILVIKAGLSKLEHDAENKHSNYKYTSSDAVYEALRKRLADAGLVVLALETECEKGPDGKSIKATFNFVLATEKATWWSPHNTRTVYQPWMGAQTFQAAQSYAEKAFLKSVFKLSTGEPDSESVLQEAPVEAPKKRPAKRQLDAAASSKLAESIVADLRTLAIDKRISVTDAEVWTEKWSADLDTLDASQKDVVREAFRAAKKGPLA